MEEADGLGGVDGAAAPHRQHHLDVLGVDDADGLLDAHDGGIGHHLVKVDHLDARPGHQALHPVVEGPENRLLVGGGDQHALFAVLPHHGPHLIEAARAEVDPGGLIEVKVFHTAPLLS